MRLHSIENKSKRFSGRPSFNNCQQDTGQNFYSKQIGEEKVSLHRCESASGLVKKNHGLEAQYRELEQNYRHKIKKMKSRAEELNKQKKQLESFKSILAREDKEIIRLKELLRISKLDDNKEYQYLPQQDSPLQKLDDESELTTDEKRSSRKTSRDKHRNKQQTGGTSCKGYERLGLSKRYKFVPTLNFKHSH